MCLVPKSLSPEHETVGLSFALTLREPHTMHTARAVLKQLKRTTGTQPEVLISDRGSWGGKDFGNT